MATLQVLLVALVAGAVTVNGQSDCWDVEPNTNIHMGVWLDHIQTIADCQAACVANASCTGVDWNTAADPHECWMHGHWSGAKSIGDRPGITHYAYNSTCRNRDRCWTLETNTNVENGVRVHDATNRNACRRACVANTSCTGIDLNSDETECYIHGHWSGGKNIGNTPGVTHHAYAPYCREASTVTPRHGTGTATGRGDCRRWTWEENTSRNGGHGNDANDLCNCRMACVIRANCIAVDWDDGAGMNQKCWLHSSASGLKNEGNSPGVDYGTFDRSCPPCAWRMENNTGFDGGQQNEANTICDCQRACINLAGCTGFDWSRSADMNQRCWLGGSWSSNKNTNRQGIIYFALDRSCLDMNRTTATPTPSPRTPDGTTHSGCRPWTPEDDTNRNNGVRVGHADSLEECRMACKDNASCTAIDWNGAADVGQKCWIHGHWSGEKSVGNRPGIIHEQYDRACDTGVCRRWTAEDNTGRDDGQRNDASTLHDCQQACVDNDDCTGLDWSGSAAMNQRCWLHGHWSGQKNPNREGVTYYALNRGCPPGSRSPSPASPRTTQTGTRSPDCRPWRRENATNRNDGRRVGDADSLGECRMACRDNASCTAIDWNDQADPGQKCWIHGHWSGGKNVGNRPGIIHEEIDRDCGTGSSPSPTSPRSPRTTGTGTPHDVTATTRPPGCVDTWRLHEDTGVDEGRQNDASSLEDCQMACKNIANCTGIDWSANANAGEKCWLHGHWSGTRHNGSRSEVDHYDLIRCTDQERCMFRWTRFPDSNVPGGIVILARDLRDCQDACANSPNCTGVDWNATAPAGRRCWMIGPWSEQEMNNGTAMGIDHYRIERPTDCDDRRPRPRFPRHWEYVAEVQKYYRAVFELVTWDVAHNRCREFGPRSHLAEINSARENEALKKFIDSFDRRLARICVEPSVFNPGYRGYWTSGQRLDASSCQSNWVWKAFPEVSTPVTYRAWKPNEPNCESGQESCVAISPVTAGAMSNDCWEDVRCERLLCPLCELDLGF